MEDHGRPWKTRKTMEDMEDHGRPWKTMETMEDKDWLTTSTVVTRPLFLHTERKGRRKEKERKTVFFNANGPNVQFACSASTGALHL